MSFDNSVNLLALICLTTVEYMRSRNSVGFPNNVCRNTLRKQYAWTKHIHEVTDFHGGFLAIFFALISNTRWTTQLMNIYICVGNI